MANKNDNGKNAVEARKKRVIAVIAVVLAALFLVWTIAGSMMFSFGDDSSDSTSVSTQSSSSDSSNSEMRGIWVSTVASLDYPTTQTTSAESLKAQADQVINDCYNMGMNAIFLQVRPASDAFYESSYYPWSKYLTGTQGQAPSDGFDPLEYWVEKAHEKGIELHAWINPYRITTSEGGWEELSDDNPAKGAYNDYVVEYDGKYYFDPGEPAVRDLIVKGVLEIVNNYDVDGIHFDDYFYPGSSFDDSESYAAYGNGMDKAEWRRNNVNTLVQEVNQAVHDADSHCVFGISPMGIWANKSTTSLGSDTNGGESYTDRYADSYTWVKNGWVDYIAPQIYWNIGYSIADYKTLAEWWSDVVDGTDVKLYIGMADYRANATSGVWAGTDELIRQLQLNTSLPNVSGEIHFRYKYVAGSTELYQLYVNAYASNRVSANTDPAGADDDDTTTTDDPSGLNDISGHWAESYIRTLVSAGIVSGMGDGTFKPDNNVTRAEFVKMLAASAGVTDFSSIEDAGFSDVSDSAWYADYVNWAVAEGIAKGTDVSTFSPEKNITRAEMAVMICNYADATGITLDDTASSIEFADSSDIPSWAEESVDRAVRAGILSGVDVTDDDGSEQRYFYPLNNATRAEAARVICALIEL
ncbi:MAG: family 10 glycosylhydrolase [Anaerovoracaceae bacterium]|jgi:uncharacterized lipoprotein YddW (UPF0748 family)